MDKAVTVTIFRKEFTGIPAALIIFSFHGLIFAAGYLAGAA